MTARDPDEIRRANLQRWEHAAPGWAARRPALQAAAQPVSLWMLEAIDPQPGDRVLELAAGPGDTGLLAAELVQPGGTLISTDVAEPMVDAARARAAELDIPNAEFRVMGAEWIDLPAADVDGVLCRWGYMLLADPAAALRETRRVLRPGRRVALAAWAAVADNPWAAVPREELVKLGAMPPPDPSEPGMFDFADPERIHSLLEDAGFTEIEVDQVDIVFRHPDLDAWWDTQLDLSTLLREKVGALTPAQRDQLRDAIDPRLADHVAPDGSVALPGRTHVAAASA